MTAVEVRQFVVTTPRGTTKTSPQTTDLTFPPFEVLAIEWRVPPGPNGTMGFRIGASGQQILPWLTGDWIVANDESYHWDLTGLPNSGSYECVSYNEGNFDHAVYLRFFLSTIVPVTSVLVHTAIPNDLLSQGAAS